MKKVESQDENQTPSIATHKIISNRIDGVDNLERRNEEETMIELNDMLGVPSDDSWARDIVVADVGGDDRPGFLIGHDGRLNPLLLKVGDGTFKGSCEEDRDTEIEEQLNIDDEEVPVGVIHEARVDTDYTRIDSENISNDFVTKDSQDEKSHPSQKIGGTKFESNDEDRENTSARSSSSTIMDKETHDSIDEEILSSTSLADDVVAESNDNDDEKTETMQLRMFSKVSRSESDMSLAEVLGDADNKYEEESPDSLEKKSYDSDIAGSRSDQQIADRNLPSGNNSLADILDGDVDENEKSEELSSEELKLNVTPFDESSEEVVGGNAAPFLPSHSFDCTSEIETMSAASFEVVVEGKGIDDDWTGIVQLEGASISSSLDSSSGVGKSHDEIVNEIVLQGSEEESHEAATSSSIEESSSEMINVVVSSEGDNE